MNSKAKGERSVGAIIARFLKIGIPVSVPLSDNLRYDLVVEKEGVLLKIQCKTGRLRGDVIEFNTASSHFKTYKRTAYRKDVDLFAVYCEEVDGVYLVPVSEVGETEGYLRIADPIKKRPGQRFAKDFQI